MDIEQNSFYLALYRIGRYIDSARGAIQKQDLVAAMPHVAEISTIAQRLYQALSAANKNLNTENSPGAGKL